MEKIGKYTKIIILSTMAEPKKLLDLSITWFNNKGRLYQADVTKEINKAVEEDWLIREDKNVYKANMQKVIPHIISLIHLGENHKLVKKYQQELEHFYRTLGEYTQKVYLNNEVIKSLTKFNREKGAELDLALLIQLPFILRFVQYKDKLLANIIIQAMNLEEYVDVIGKLEYQYFPILKERKRVDEWVKTFDKIISLLPKLEKKGLSIIKNTQKIK